MIRATFECESNEDLVKWATELLIEFGYEVKPPSALHEKETPAAFARRIGIHPGTFSRKLRLPECPKNYTSRSGATGRLVWLQASPEFEEFMRTPQFQGGNSNGKS